MKLLWLALLAPFLANAAPKSHTEHLKARLISEVSEASPGSSFLAAIEFKLEKGWHVYWQNPGDYGDAPRLVWPEHADFGVSNFLWPMPRKIQVGTIVSFGYEDEVLLPFTVTLPEPLSTSTVEIAPEVHWLVCKDICIPGKAKLSLTLPVHASSLKFDPVTAPEFTVVKKMLPQMPPSSVKLSGTLTSDQFILNLRDLPPHTNEIGFFPVDGDDVNYAGPSKIQNSPNALEIHLQRSDRLLKAVTHFPALLVLHSTGGDTVSYSVDIPLGEPVRASSVFSFLLPLFFAFLGGLLLNLMPCVFPVLSIKAMSVLKMSGESQTNVRKMGWAYTLGILASFWVLVGTLIFLRLGGRQIGWGFQLQSPQFVFGLACILFVFGLNLLGLFEISGSFMNFGGKLAERNGISGSFFTGVLATLVATPCSAPFMGSAIGFALSQSSVIIFLIFTALGFGLALPYLLICYLPQMIKILPKPGAWMETFQQLMAFFIFATVLWLAWVLGLQVASTGLVLLLAAFIWIGFSLWIYIRFKKISGFAIVAGIAGVIALTLALAKVSAPASALAEMANPNELQWEKFSPEKVAEYRNKGQPVFVDFTAAWCVSCQLNEALVFRSDAVKEKLKSLHIALLKGDWTNEDPAITKTLQSFGRDGVPFYLIYPKGTDAPAIPLPEVINAGLVLTELEKLK
jgi:thiol:disulfide interchange protein/DsbC/DsbD-like thiol-disulfide interchange protein